MSFFALRNQRSLAKPLTAQQTIKNQTRVNQWAVYPNAEKQNLVLHFINNPIGEALAHPTRNLSYA